MTEEFEATLQHDPKIIHVTFGRKDGRDVLEILARNREDTVYFRQGIKAARGIYEMDTPEKQNFEIKCDEPNGLVEVSGNIFNAFKLLKETQLISSQLAEVITANNKVAQFLEGTKDFVLPGNVDIKKTLPLHEVDAAIEEKYAEQLLRVGPEGRQAAIAKLAKLLIAKGADEVEGINLQIKQSPRKSPIVY
jgi:hypothetical protein